MGPAVPSPSDLNHNHYACGVSVCRVLSLRSRFPNHRDDALSRLRQCGTSRTSHSWMSDPAVNDAFFADAELTGFYPGFQSGGGFLREISVPRCRTTVIRGLLHIGAIRSSLTVNRNSLGILGSHDDR